MDSNAIVYQISMICHKPITYFEMELIKNLPRCQKNQSLYNTLSSQTRQRHQSKTLKKNWT